MNATTSPVNLVLHSIQSLMAGGDASVTPTFKLFPLPFHPGDGFHEYRFGMSSLFPTDFSSISNPNRLEAWLSYLLCRWEMAC